MLLDKTELKEEETDLSEELAKSSFSNDIDQVQFY